MNKSLDDWSNLFYSGAMNTKLHDTRQHILDVGYQLVVSKGFTSVGLAQLLNTAHVPKGSFYHYFKSKEQFGEALIQDYFCNYLQKLDELFNDTSQSAYQRLLTYFTRWQETENGTCNANRCLVVKLSAEVSDLSESMRLALADGARKITTAMAQVIEQGIKDGSIQVENSHDCAIDIYNMWIGASVLHKLYQDAQGLERCLSSTKARLGQK